MKFAVAKEHRRYFRENHSIAFEDFFSDSQLKDLLNSVEGYLLKAGEKPTSEKVFSTGRDCWRKVEELKKFTCQRKLLDILESLIEKKKLMLAFDQVFVAPDDELPKENSVYQKLVNEVFPAKEWGSVQNVRGAILIGLTGRDAGQVTVLDEEGVLDLSQLEGLYYLVVYAELQSRYIQNENDPMTHSLKDYGYSFGDRLGNPVLYQ